MKDFIDWLINKCFFGSEEITFLAVFFVFIVFVWTIGIYLFLTWQVQRTIQHNSAQHIEFQHSRYKYANSYIKPTNY